MNQVRCLRNGRFTIPQSPVLSHFGHACFLVARLLRESNGISEYCQPSRTFLPILSDVASGISPTWGGVICSPGSSSGARAGDGPDWRGALPARYRRR